MYENSAIHRAKLFIWRKMEASLVKKCGKMVKEHKITKKSIKLPLWFIVLSKVEFWYRKNIIK